MEVHPNPAHRIQGWRRGRMLGAAVLLVGLLLSLGAALWVRHDLELRHRRQFEAVANGAVEAIDKRMAAYVAMIRSGAALFTASDEVTRDEFRRFVHSLDLPRNYPGIQGLGFAERLEGPPAEREAAVRRALDGYVIHAADPGHQESAIIFLEPEDERNLAALGYDMYGEPTRRAAMAQARDTGEPATTRKVTLVQEITPEQQAGFLIYVPLYRASMPTDTVEQRRSAIAGWVYSPFRAGDLMAGVFGAAMLPWDVEVFTSLEADPADLIYDADGIFRGMAPASSEAELIAVRQLEVAGQKWLLVFRTPEPLGPPTEAWLPAVVFAGTLLVSLLLFSITWSQVREREAAETATEERSLLLDRERIARTEAEAARSRASFLADATTQLASSLASPTLLEQVARRTVSFLGGACAIDLVRPDGNLHREVMVVDDPGVERIANEFLRGRIVDPTWAPAVAEVTRTGRSVVLERYAPAFIEGLPPGLREIARALGSAVVVPLRARERTLGAITVYARQQGRYGAAEQALVEDLAWRVALAVDNARLYAEAQEAVRIRDEFLSIASHELRTPLTVLQAHLQGMLRALRRDELQPGRVEEKLNTALRQTQRLGKLVADLLDVSRITAGRLELERERFDLAELAAELVDRFRAEASRAGSELRLETGSGATGLWDRHRLEQVLTNLLSNAIKYGAGSPVQVEVAQRDGKAMIEVTDRGIGIPPEAQGRIFGRFERAASERHYGGLGLGLFISRQIVAAHGGTIVVRSAPGTGSTFCVTLPREPQAEASA